MLKQIAPYLENPTLDAPSTHPFWDDPHIAKGMLEAHLNPDWDAASRKHDFLDASVRWIAQVAPTTQHRDLLDLGCGPGLYAERFQQAGYTVTGVDLSTGSIAYAREQTQKNGSGITYRCENYLQLPDTEAYDLVTLIYCDYPALSNEHRPALLEKVFRALRPGGKFILDVFTPAARKPESRTWSHSAGPGFWTDAPHLCLDSDVHYENGMTELWQHIIVTEAELRCYHIWNHLFTKESLLAEILPAGFREAAVYGDVAGKPFDAAGDTLCGVFTK